MRRDLRDYESVSDFLEAVRSNREALAALDEAALSGDSEQLARVQAAMFALKFHRLPTA
jgi:hypothetical protein